MIIIDFLREWIRNLVLIILLAHFIEMLLPSSKMKRYVKVVVGFFVILMILTPFLEIVNQGVSQFGFEIIENKKTSWRKIVDQGERLREIKKDKVRGDYKRRLSQHIRAMVKLNSNLDNIKVGVTLDAANNLETISITGVRDKIVPVQVDLSNQTKKASTSQMKGEELKDLISTLYGLNANQIRVKMK
ncbi:stage III sporulation protein AF [Halobacteroides halobius DSM 5150]|uniref:Stage III sporulation protein AF n=1 Tax=Halobacteroides halobius (strain ATCC 35273 / DSM 5150 / MD-1) TaxID=748449 RepID=L0K5F7_HALHC|nr:stage III sporulation protein AF [Halobacteroides halobius]AGB40512.1 stage III sporulation protein AF [Halobacteroides halobius DSM 5150]